jgi:hypothetical protein
MANKLESRVRRLEAHHEHDGLAFIDELTVLQMQAFRIFLEAERHRRSFDDLSSDEVTDEFLAQQSMSRESYEAAMTSIPNEWGERLRAWCDRREFENSSLRAEQVVEFPV